MKTHLCCVDRIMRLVTYYKDNMMSRKLLIHELIGHMDYRDIHDFVDAVDKLPEFFTERDIRDILSKLGYIA